MLIAGAAWIIFVSLISALMQTLAPDWVRARVLAVFLLVFQGSIAAGSATWGFVGQHVGVRGATLCRPRSDRLSGAEVGVHTAGRDLRHEPLVSLAHAGHP
jgi:hypothetical protein